MVLAVSGEVDLYTARQLSAAAVEVILALRPDRLLVGLAAVDFIDACGMRNLVAVKRLVEISGGTVRVINVQGGPLRALTLAGLMPVLCGQDLSAD